MALSKKKKIIAQLCANNSIQQYLQVAGLENAKIQELFILVSCFNG
jgi:hypothetical protein